MGRAFGFISLIIVMAVGLYIYSKQVTSITPAMEGGNPKAGVDLIGVRNDLLRFATVERQHLASDGHYISRSEMHSGGDTCLPADSRGPYDYAVEGSGGSFTATATYRGTPPAGVPRVLKITDAGNIEQE